MKAALFILITLLLSLPAAAGTKTVRTGSLLLSGSGDPLSLRGAGLLAKEIRQRCGPVSAGPNPFVITVRSTDKPGFLCSQRRHPHRGQGSDGRHRFVFEAVQL